MCGTSLLDEELIDTLEVLCFMELLFMFYIHDFFLCVCVIYFSYFGGSHAFFTCDAETSEGKCVIRLLF